MHVNGFEMERFIALHVSYKSLFVNISLQWGKSKSSDKANALQDKRSLSSPLSFLLFNNEDKN